MRLFVALDIPTKTRAALAARIAQLRPTCPEAKWVRPDTIHLTLKFIGHTAAENLPRLREALAQVRSHEPIEMQFRGMGFFPDARRPRVLWCGAEMSANTPTIVAEIDKAVSALKIGVEPDRRPFAPHLTLARLDPEKCSRKGRAGLSSLIDALKQSADSDFGLLQAGEFHLFASDTKPTGAEYERLDTFQFIQAAT